MQWTDRIRQVKIILVVAAVLIAMASLFISHYLVRDLSIEEHNKMEVWAEAMRALNQADEETDLNLVLKVINENNTIPVIVLDRHGEATTFRNINPKGSDFADSLQKASVMGQDMLRAGQAIKIYLNDEGKGDFINVCYDDSVMIKRLSMWPYVQLGIVMVFVVIESDLLISNGTVKGDGESIYVLAKKGEVVGFYLLTKDEVIPAGKAYYKAPAGDGARAFIALGGDVTGIKTVESVKAANNAIYNLAGQRLVKAQKGLNIVNGKKIMK